MNLSHFFAKNSVRSQSVHFPFGSVVFQQGQEGEAFYIVQSGRLRVMKQDGNGTSMTVGYLYAGDHFGEGALLTRQGHRATVRAVEDADVLQVPKDEFFKAVRKSSDVKDYLEEQIACIAYRDFTRFLKGDVPGEAMRVLFARLKREAVEKGVTVVDRGQFGQRFYLIGSGQLKAVLENGDTVILRPGDYFGDEDLSDDKRVIRSRRDSVLFYIDKSDFNKLKAMMPGFEEALERGRISRGDRGSNGVLLRQAQPKPTVVRAEEEGQKSSTASNVVNIRIDGEKPQVPTWFRFPFLKQHDQSDCGAACLGMICKYYKMPIGLNRLRDMSNVSRYGTSMAALAEAAETIGFVTRGVRTGYEALMRTELPAILHWEGNHFVVLYQINKKEVKIADPGVGIRKLSRAEFEKGWTNMALLLDYTDQVAENEPSQSSFKRFFPLIRPYTSILIEVLLASLVLSLFGLASPIFMQTIIDQVLVHHDKDLLNLMLVG
ncbi:MAG: cysteine peptidase family C39 domain-containing protein, partial [Gemmatimonadetes bacterium]|nr:cysteine peptidase family C39 domain-containing protein [Gemmatimonadota bacterium]